MRKILVAVALVASTALIPLSSLPAHAATAPAITAAVALDQNGDDHIDGIQLTYSTKIVHPLDKDHSYPFTVAGYKITKVGKAKGTQLTIDVKQLAAKDIEATPSVTYTQTSSDPVTSKSGIQAYAETYVGTQSLDPDGDGYTVADGDCAPLNPTIHPGAVDLPDLEFIDSNCDGIDGDAATAVFVSPDGSDSNPGTESEPVQGLQQALVIAGSTVPPRPIYVAAGNYLPVFLESSALNGVGIYGGYSASDWSRSLSNVTTLGFGAGEPALEIDGFIGVKLQLLTLDGGGLATDSQYGLVAVDGANVAVEQLTISAGNADAGTSGYNGGAGEAGGNGNNGGGTLGGAGGDNGYPGGAGGNAGTGSGNGVGGGGGSGPSGGAGGTGGAGTTGRPGLSGGNGSPGADGATGSGGLATTQYAGDGGWGGMPGANGTYGASGSGGGGGGGGGGLIDVERCTSAGHACPGGGGGGGGGGGLGGQGGGLGTGGNGSFGIYLWNANLSFMNPSLSSCVITAGNGGTGGTGGAGGLGGAGGTGGTGATALGGRGGNGGNGGAGGAGGSGGGGEGGPSIGIFVGTGSTLSPAVPDCSITIGTGGAGGAPNGESAASISAPIVHQ